MRQQNLTGPPTEFSTKGRNLYFSSMKKENQPGCLPNHEKNMPEKHFFATINTSFTKNNNRRKRIDKNQCDVLIESQRADGHFIDIDKVYPNLTVISKKYSNLEIDVLSNIVAITLFRTHFKEKKMQ
ncbi:hypothetical protein QTN25_005951 [Entamoeba marina]